MLENIVSGEPISVWMDNFASEPTPKKLNIINDPVIKHMWGIDVKEVAKELSERTFTIDEQTQQDFNLAPSTDAMGDAFHRYIMNKLALDALKVVEDKEGESESSMMFKRHVFSSRLCGNNDNYYDELLINDLAEVFDSYLKASSDAYMSIHSDEHNFYLGMANFVARHEKVSKYLKLVNIDLSNFLADILS